MAGTLFTYPNNFRAHKCLIAAEYSGKDVAQGKFCAGVTEKSEEFLAKFPMGKVPAYSDANVNLNETNAIAFHLSNDTLKGGENMTHVLNWMSFADSVLEPAACTWVYPTLGMYQFNNDACNKAKETVKCAMQLLNNHLMTKTFLVGERITLADISIACNMVMLYKHVMVDSFRNQYPNVNRWFLTCVNQDEFKSVIGKVNMCTKEAKFDGKKYNEIFGKKKEAAPKKEKKAAKAKKESGDSKPAAAAPAQQAPAKKVDPWANSPAATMDMDAWKRCYSNEKPDAYLKYFEEHFPKDTYSIWRGKYMYNNELTLDFLANNLINGMLQRLEKLRKHAFGVMCLLKTPSGFEIEGLWCWRGQDLAFELCDDWKVDYETYSWEKLDNNADSTKKLTKDFFVLLNDMYIDGKEVITHSVYK